MAHYLIEVGYTTQSWNTQIDKQGNAIERITPALQTCGATLVCMYYAFGETDVVGVIDFPSPEDAAAFSLALSASGALRSFRTTPLLSIDQGIEAMRRAQSVREVYEAPLTVSLIPQPASVR